MYVTYEEYLNMGGTADRVEFLAAERRARYLLNAQASGGTGRKLAQMESVPQGVKDCIFDLIAYAASFSAGTRQVSGESQSQGGASESISYVTKTDEQMQAEQEDIIYNTLYGAGLGWLLYRGVCL